MVLGCAHCTFERNEDKLLIALEERGVRFGPPSKECGEESYSLKLREWWHGISQSAFGKISETLKRY